MELISVHENYKLFAICKVFIWNLSPLIIQLFTIYHPTLSESSFHQYQPVKSLDNGATLIYLTLDYKAQLYFVKQNWKITLLGSTLSICDPDKWERTSPDITQDLGNVESMGLEDQNK